MTATTQYSASCACGRVTLEAIGAPILSAVCFCDSCRSAAREFEQAPGAPSVLNRYGGVDYCLFRKDRVRLTRGEENLRSHRLTETSGTRRVVAACCNSPLFLDFISGHWLTLYRNRMHGNAPPLEMCVMAKDRAADHVSPEGLPIYQTHPPRFMIKLVAAWAAMGFRRPKLAW